MAKRSTKKDLHLGNTSTFRESGLRVYISELVWPGKEDDVVDIENKWIYVILSQKVIAEVYAFNKNKWEILYNPTPKTPEPKRKSQSYMTEGFVELDPDFNHQYHFFLSPIQLTAEGIDYLLTWTEESTVKKNFNSNPGFVNLSDSWKWAEDIHLYEYLPALENRDTWLEDKEAQSRFFIASTLKHWIIAGLGITNELKDPANIDKEINVELEIRKLAEEVCSKMANCIDSHSHRIIEISAQHNGGEDLAHAFLHWCTITNRLLDSEPGRYLAYILIRDENRILRTHIFTDTQKYSILDFKIYRHGWYGAFGTFSELAPAMINFLKRDSLKKMKSYLDNLEIQCGQKEFTDLKHIPLKLTIKRAQKLFVQKLKFSPPEFFSELAGTAAELGKRADNTINHFKVHLKKFELPIGTILEIINVWCAWRDYLNATQKEREDKGITLIGAFGDAYHHFAPFLSELASKRNWIRLGKGLKAFGPIAGFIGGAVDMINYGKEALNGVNQNNYGSVVGNSISSIGGATFALGSGMAVSAMALKFIGISAFGGPAGLIIGAIGAVLIISGLAVASFFMKTPYENFARLCFLGKDRGKTEIFSWASRGIGDGSPSSEANILLNLLGSFQLSVSYNPRAILRMRPAIDIKPNIPEQPEPEYLREETVPAYGAAPQSTQKIYRTPFRKWIRIDFGYLTEVSVYEVRLEWYMDISLAHQPRNIIKHQEPTILELYPLEKVEKNVSGPNRVSTTYLSETIYWTNSNCCFGVDTYTEGRFYGWLNLRIFVRLRVLGNLEVWVPPSRQWLEIDTGKFRGQWNLGRDVMIISSFDGSCYVQLKD